MTDASNIVIAPAIVYSAPVGEPLPADSVPAETDWGGNWTNVGYTKIPVTWTGSRTKYKVMVEQSTMPVKSVTTEETHIFETALSELTAANLQAAMGGTATVTAPDVGQVGKEEVAGGGEVCLEERAWGFEGAYCNGAGTKFPVRVFIYRGNAIINGALSFAKAEEASIPLQIEALEDSAQPAGERGFLFQRVTAEALP